MEFVFYEYLRPHESGQYSNELLELEEDLFPGESSGQDSWWLRHINDGIVLLVWDGAEKAKLLGLFTASFEHSIAGICCGEREAHISTFGIQQAYRKKGLGSRLFYKGLKYIVEEYKANRITLEVRSQNEAAITLYKKFGFSRTHVKRDYYSRPPDHADVMEYNESRLWCCPK